ncbi:MAG: hypothetical protein IJA30_06320 [Bacilli bacterium]|nr:hypothetical protein [Bacilli bacterium]
MTDYMTANTINDIFRSLFALLDRATYWLLGIMYEILFNVASADIFANETVQKFYGRVQMIIGVFMIFKLAVSIIQGIINPDTFTDKKSGFSSIIGRIVFALIMLTVLTPINIPGARTDYEINLNNNGLLFGTLYELQDRILENNTLGRLILGTNDGTSSGNTATTQQEKLKKSANMFTSTILKGFVRINLKDTGTDETKPEDRVCSYIDQDVLDAYSSLEASPNQILSLVNASCEGQNEGFFEKMAGFFKRLFSGDRYVFAYIPIISTIVGAVFIYILLGEIITIAIRSIKLAVLRLLAPIPIISYIDPKSEKDGAFSAWVKSLTSTYLELFMHLAVIYFVIFLIQDMIVNGLVINTGTGIIGVISAIFIWIGLFFFVKQAPKFIKDILGIKGASSNVGLAGLLGGTAMAVGGGGMKGFALGAMQGTEAATQGYNQGKAVPLGSVWSQNSDLMAKIRTGDKDAKGGVFGAMQDRLNFDTRERRANMLGIGREAIADAKYISDVREAQAATAKRELDAATMEYNNLSPTATAAERTAARERYEKAYRQYDAYQIAAAKAKKKYDEMDKDRGNFGVGPRVSDKRRHQNTLAYRLNGEDYDDNDYVIREGTYRSPITTNEDSKNSPIGGIDYAHLPDSDAGNITKATGNRDQDILDEVSGHKRDLKDFSGTTDDSTIGSSGHGAGGGPGGPRP